MEEPLTFDSAFESEFDYVCHTLRRFGVRDADLEDVAQTVFLAVHQRFDQYDGSRPIRPWLAAFAVRGASNYRRTLRRRSEQLGSEVQTALVDGRSAEAVVDQQRAVQQVLNQMDFDRRVVLVMFDVDGYSAPEIAAALELPLNTVYSRIRLARRDFRALGSRLFGVSP
ncbi:MAG: sigma-70 family RNA polymerase sigma factor [Myxococcota bacterium]